jgi:alpha-L-rhamnosidase
MSLLFLSERLSTETAGQAGNPAAGSCGDVAWTAAFPLIAHDLYTYYGDLRVAQRLWPSLVHYTANLIAKANSSADHLAECDEFQDWFCSSPATGPNASSCCTNSTDLAACPVGAEMASFSYVLVLRAMASMAEALSKSNQASSYSALAANATAAFHAAFWDEQAQTYGSDLGGTQSLVLPALDIGSPPAALHPRVVQSLSDDLELRTDYHLAVGAVTAKILLKVLSDNGLHSSAMRVATQTTEPSWGWWWTQNSTTCWEAFPENESDKASTSASRTPQGQTTKNHIFLCGGVGQWFWQHLVGLTPVAPGFASVRIAPQLDCDHGPHSLNASFLSVRGLIETSWKISLATGTVSLTVVLPIGVQGATILVPKPFTSNGTHSSARASSAVVFESGHVVWDGHKLSPQRNAGIVSAEDRLESVSFSVLGNAAFRFLATDARVYD